MRGKHILHVKIQGTGACLHFQRKRDFLGQLEAPDALRGAKEGQKRWSGLHFDLEPVSIQPAFLVHPDCRGSHECLPHRRTAGDLELPCAVGELEPGILGRAQRNDERLLFCEGRTPIHPENDPASDEDQRQWPKVWKDIPNISLYLKKEQHPEQDQGRSPEEIIASHLDLDSRSRRRSRYAQSRGPKHTRQAGSK